MLDRNPLNGPNPKGAQQQEFPGTDEELNPSADHGAERRIPYPCLGTSPSDWPLGCVG